MSKLLRAALVGYGSVAEKMHAPLLEVCPTLDFVAVVERNGFRCQQKYPKVHTFPSLEALLAADAADLICITTPNELHFSMAKQCLLSGKHVVVDKPVTLVAEEAEELLALARSKNLICSIFHNRRYDGDFKTLQEIVAKNLLGRLVYLESHFDRFRPQVSENWREKAVPGNGITYDLGSHLIDQVVLLFGKPTAIWADIRLQRSNALSDDYFDIGFDYPDFKARVTAGAMVNVPTPKFLLLGEKGTYQKFYLDVQEQAFKDKKIPAGDDWGVEPEARWGHIHYEQETQAYPTLRGDYRVFYENVADAIWGKAPLMVTLEQAIPVLRIIQATFVSSKEGRKISQEEGKW